MSNCKKPLKIKPDGLLISSLDNYPSLAVEPENPALVSVVIVKTNADRNPLSESSCTIQCSEFFKIMNKNVNVSKIITDCE